MRISDWSSDVCSSDLTGGLQGLQQLSYICIHGFQKSRIVYLFLCGTCSQEGFVFFKQPAAAGTYREIGRASCRERVSVRVDLGGRRIIKKKKNKVLK